MAGISPKVSYLLIQGCRISKVRHFTINERKRRVFSSSPARDCLWDVKSYDGCSVNPWVWGPKFTFISIALNPSFRIAPFCIIVFTCSMGSMFFKKLILGYLFSHFITTSYLLFLNSRDNYNLNPKTLHSLDPYKVRLG